MTAGAFPALGFDPAPGDVTEAARLTSTLRSVGAEIAGVRDELRSIGNVEGAWLGKAAMAFIGQLGELPSYLERAENSMDGAYRALNRWQYDLEDFEHRGRVYEQRAEEARQRVAAARASLNGLPPVTGQMTDRQSEELTQQIHVAQRAYNAADDELGQIVQQAKRMLDEHQQMAGEVARWVRDAAEHAPPEPGWFEQAAQFLGEVAAIHVAIADSIANWFQEHAEVFKMIGDVLADAAMVVGMVVGAIALFTNPAGWMIAAGIGLSAGALLLHGAAKAGGAKVTNKTLVMVVVSTPVGPGLTA